MTKVVDMVRGSGNIDTYQRSRRNNNMHTYISNRYRELRIQGHTQQNWCTMVLVMELSKRHPRVKSHAALVAEAVQRGEFLMIWFEVCCIATVNGMMTR
jgi:hypothetical protein